MLALSGARVVGARVGVALLHRVAVFDRRAERRVGALVGAIAGVAGQCRHGAARLDPCVFHARELCAAS